MNILITGGSGFVGTFLTRELLGKGHKVVAVDAVPPKTASDQPRFRFVRADTTRPGDWQGGVADVDAVINLAGRNIFHYWTKKYKKEIYDTRVLTTRNLVDALPDNPKVVVCSTSAVGYYGSRGEAVLDETAAPGDDFLATVSMDWEAEALRAREKGARVVLTRFGIVMGPGGGALKQMVPAFKFFLGGPLGDGSQWFSWIQIEDLVGAMIFALEHATLDGPVNFCSPEPVRNRRFVKALAHQLGRPAFLRVPGFALRLAAGELGEVVLGSQRVVPSKLDAAGFEFKFPQIEDALRVSV